MTENKEEMYLKGQVEKLTKAVKDGQESISQILYAKKAFSERLKHLQKNKK